MEPGVWELEWSAAGPGVRLRGSPLWFDAWPRDGAGFLSSLDALSCRRVRGPVLCTPEMTGMLRVLRPGARILPLAGSIGLGRLRLEAWATAGTPGVASLLVEKDGRRLLYLREGAEAPLIDRWTGTGGPTADTVLWASREPAALPEGEGTGQVLSERDLPTLQDDRALQGPATCLVVEGPGSALRVLTGLRNVTGPVRVSGRIGALYRVLVGQGLHLPPVRCWDGRRPLAPGSLALWIVAGRSPIPEACTGGGIRWLRMVPVPDPEMLARVVRAVRAVRVVLAGPGASTMGGSLNARGLQVEVLGPPRLASLF